MRVFTIGFVVLIIVTLGIIGCSSNSSKSTQQSEKVTYENVLPGTYLFAQNNYSITYSGCISNQEIFAITDSQNTHFSDTIIVYVPNFGDMVVGKTVYSIYFNHIGNTLKVTKKSNVEVDK